ncbi:MAG: AMP-dependent synthetase [Acidobacteria bacterium CG_4_9_14_3_um_filter_49_7]|nr:MAG: AMP-dependent synthetase [Acidobacteria bacterium CG_4_9_14_3_um_filter_49_7]
MTDRRWTKFYGDISQTLDYPRKSLYEVVMDTVEKMPDAVATDFFGSTMNYRQLGRYIDRTADMLASLGFGAGDRITISMPTSPQGVAAVYAANKLGGVASMIHPLSPSKEVRDYLTMSKSRFALTLDAFYPVFEEARTGTALETLILTRVSDEMPALTRIGFKITVGRKIRKVPDNADIVWWHEAMAKKHSKTEKAVVKADDLAAILYSGGTTGTSKGIMLSNYNLVSEGMMVAKWGKMDASGVILAILPIFHGFGLGVCINAAFMGGAKSILVPKFTPEDVAKLIRKKRPNFLVGVPTLFEALSRSPVFQKTDLSCLKAVFSGADTLPHTVKKRFDTVVKSGGGSSELQEGYGLTEAVTAIMAMPLSEYREGSIGVPFPDMDAKIVKVDTTESLPVGEEGEICLSGPAVMLGYLDNPEETVAVLKEHEDGQVWLHTGDLGTMDEDGFFFFKQRLKRLIKSSGMNVYPSQVEAVLHQHPAVAEACVIGIPDPEQIERVKAYVVLENQETTDVEMADELIRHCRKNLIKWSCPREVVFRDELPKTAVGKVAFRVLLDEEIARLKATGEYAGPEGDQ